VFQFQDWSFPLELDPTLCFSAFCPFPSPLSVFSGLFFQRLGAGALPESSRQLCPQSCFKHYSDGVPLQLLYLLFAATSDPCPVALSSHICFYAPRCAAWIASLPPLWSIFLNPLFLLRGVCESRYPFPWTPLPFIFSYFLPLPPLS